MAVILYLDASALVKLVHLEDDSDLAIRIWEAATISVTSRLAYAEARAALAAVHRSGRLSPGHLKLATKRLDHYMTEISEIDLGEELSRAAGEVAERGRLHGADAVHLATALLLRRAQVLFATWDRSLARAAAEADLEVVPASR
jgi:predicted nucleic acid-binding protein